MPHPADFTSAGNQDYAGKLYPGTCLLLVFFSPTLRTLKRHAAAGCHWREMSAIEDDHQMRRRRHPGWLQPLSCDSLSHPDSPPNVIRTSVSASRVTVLRLITTSCYSNGSIRPYRSYRKDRSVVFARWRWHYLIHDYFGSLEFSRFQRDAHTDVLRFTMLYSGPESPKIVSFPGDPGSHLMHGSLDPRVLITPYGISICSSVLALQSSHS